MRDTAVLFMAPAPLCTKSNNQARVAQRVPAVMLLPLKMRSEGVMGAAFAGFEDPSWLRNAS